MNFDLNIISVSSLKNSRIYEFSRDFIGGEEKFSFNEFAISVTSIFKIILKNIRFIDRFSK